MDRRDWLLIFVAADSERSVDPVRLQKGMFLLAMEAGLPPAERYAFEPYAYGPMSRELYDHMRALCETGALIATPLAGATWSTYHASPQGQDRAEWLRARAKPAALEQLAAIRRRVGELGFAELLRSVYARYPEYATRSVFRRP